MKALLSAILVSLCVSTYAQQSGTTGSPAGSILMLPMQGAVINVGMGATPNKTRGTQDKDFPFSLSEKN